MVLEFPIREYLSELSRRGVTLWLDQGPAGQGILRYKCERGSLHYRDLELLRRHKGRIVELLLSGNPQRRSQSIPRRLPSEDVPLSATQQGMWNAFERYKIKKSKRAMATAVRLAGPLNVELVRKSISYVVQRHEALRTRIAVVNGVPLQVVYESEETELPVINLIGIPADRMVHAARREIDEFINTPISLTEDALFACRLYKLGLADHVLVTALDHFIVDNLSMHILWSEIGAVYTDLFLQRPICLTSVSVQFPDYVVWEQKHHWTAQKASFWDARTKSSRRVRLPRGEPSPEARSSRWRKSLFAWACR